MNIIIETRAQANASRLKNDIIAETRNGNVDTWSYENICIGNVHYDSIYHDNDQTRNEENKIVHFRFEVIGTTIKVRESWTVGHKPDEVVRYWLWGRLTEMLMTNFSTRFYSLNIEW